MRLRWILTYALVPLAAGASAAGPDNETLYRQHCMACHDAEGESRAPDRTSLTNLSASAVLQSLDEGTMREQASPLSPEQRRSLAEFLSGKPLIEPDHDPSPEIGRCANPFPSLDAAPESPNWNGWSAGRGNSRFQPAEQAGLAANDLPRLELRWAFGFPDTQGAYAQTVVFGGVVFVTSQAGSLYALDAATGCSYWSFRAEGNLRSAPLLARAGETGDSRWAAFFGDMNANFYAVDASNGAQIWKTRLDEHPYARVTAAAAYHGGRLLVPLSSSEEAPAGKAGYACCTFRGSLSAIQAATGEVLWQSYPIEAEPARTSEKPDGTPLWGPSGGGIWSAPTVDPETGAVFVATGNHYTNPPSGEPPIATSDAIIAFDLGTGKRIWHRQFTEGDVWNFSCSGRDRANCPDEQGPDFDFGSSPILQDLPDGSRLLIAGQKSGVLHAIDPDRRGEIVWQTRVGRGGKLGGIEWGPAADPNTVFAALSNPDQRHPDQAGGLAAVRLADGEILWRRPSPECPSEKPCNRAQMAAVTVILGAVFSGSMDGVLRAYSATDGSVIWEFNTAREYETVNGVPAKGGSLNFGGPAVAGGMLFVQSGYPLWQGIPGNVLLAFGVQQD